MHSFHTRPSRIPYTTCTTNKEHTSHEHQPQILGLTLGQTLTYSKYIDNTTTKTIQILKTLTSTTWGNTQCHKQHTNQNKHTHHTPDIMLLALRQWPTGGSAIGPLEICPDGSPAEAALGIC